MTDTSGRLTGRSVLVVEDECILGLYYCDLLKTEGCIVVGPISTVQLALEALAHHRFDVVMLDLNLRGERSLAIAERLTQASIPFVVVSGYSEHQARERALRGAPFLEKPFTANTLIRTLTTALKEVRSAGARLPTPRAGHIVQSVTFDARDSGMTRM